MAVTLNLKTSGITSSSAMARSTKNSRWLPPVRVNSSSMTPPRWLRRQNGARRLDSGANHRPGFRGSGGPDITSSGTIKKAPMPLAILAPVYTDTGGVMPKGRKRRVSKFSRDGVAGRVTCLTPGGQPDTHRRKGSGRSAAKVTAFICEQR